MAPSSAIDLNPPRRVGCETACVYSQTPFQKLICPIRASPLPRRYRRKPRWPSVVRRFKPIPVWGVDVICRDGWPPGCPPGGPGIMSSFSFFSNVPTGGTPRLRRFRQEDYSLGGGPLSPWLRNHFKQLRESGNDKADLAAGLAFVATGASAAVLGTDNPNSSSGAGACNQLRIPTCRRNTRANYSTSEKRNLYTGRYTNKKPALAKSPPRHKVQGTAPHPPGHDILWTPEQLLLRYPVVSCIRRPCFVCPCIASLLQVAEQFHHRAVGGRDEAKALASGSGMIGCVDSDYQETAAVLKSAADDGGRIVNCFLRDCRRGQ